MKGREPEIRNSFNFIEMRIANLESFHLQVPYDEPEMRGERCDLIYLRVDTDNGLSGWGQAWSMKLAEMTRMVLDHAVAPYCLGMPVQESTEWMDKLCKSHGNTRGGSFSFAVSALDIALWDIRGKAANRPLHQDLARFEVDKITGRGGTTKTWVDAYASLIFYGDAERTAEKCREAVDRGYRHLKLHEEAIEPVAAARQAVGSDISIRLDPASTWPWNRVEAMEAATQLEEYELFWLEEPIWPAEDYYGLRELSRRTNVPLAAGENCLSALDFRQLREIGGATFLQPSVIKIGGISETLKVIAYAESVGAIYAPHSFYFGPGYLASLHLAAASARNTLIEQPYFGLEAYPYGDNVLVKRGRVETPMSAGLGYDPDPEFLREYAVKPA